MNTEFDPRSATVNIIRNNYLAVRNNSIVISEPKEAGTSLLSKIWHAWTRANESIAALCPLFYRLAEGPAVAGYTMHQCVRVLTNICYFRQNLVGRHNASRINYILSWIFCKTLTVPDINPQNLQPLQNRIHTFITDAIERLEDDQFNLLTGLQKIHCLRDVFLLLEDWDYMSTTLRLDDEVQRNAMRTRASELLLPIIVTLADDHDLTYDHDTIFPIVDQIMQRPRQGLENDFVNLRNKSLAARQEIQRARAVLEREQNALLTLTLVDLRSMPPKAALTYTLSPFAKKIMGNGVYSINQNLATSLNTAWTWAFKVKNAPQPTPALVAELLQDIPPSLQAFATQYFGDIAASVVSFVAQVHAFDAETSLSNQGALYELIAKRDEMEKLLAIPNLCHSRYPGLDVISYQRKMAELVKIQAAIPEYRKTMIELNRLWKEDPPDLTPLPPEPALMKLYPPKAQRLYIQALKNVTDLRAAVSLEENLRKAWQALDKNKPKLSTLREIYPLYRQAKETIRWFERDYPKGSFQFRHLLQQISPFLDALEKEYNDIDTKLRSLDYILKNRDSCRLDSIVKLDAMRNHRLVDQEIKAAYFKNFNTLLGCELALYCGVIVKCEEYWHKSKSRLTAFLKHDEIGPVETLLKLDLPWKLKLQLDLVLRAQRFSFHPSAQCPVSGVHLTQYVTTQDGRTVDRLAAETAMLDFISPAAEVQNFIREWHFWKAAFRPRNVTGLDKILKRFEKMNCKPDSWKDVPNDFFEWQSPVCELTLRPELKLIEDKIKETYAILKLVFEESRETDRYLALNHAVGNLTRIHQVFARFGTHVAFVKKLKQEIDFLNHMRLEYAVFNDVRAYRYMASSLAHAMKLIYTIANDGSIDPQQAEEMSIKIFVTNNRSTAEIDSWTSYQRNMALQLRQLPIDQQSYQRLISTAIVAMSAQFVAQIKRAALEVVRLMQITV